MSEKRKAAIGILLIALSILCCAWQPLTAPRREPEVYAASGRETQLPEIPLPKGTISINMGDAEELQELYGIGETLAAYILQEREAHGPFYYPEDLMTVRGIGVKKLEGMRETLDMTLPEGE